MIDWHLLKCDRTSPLGRIYARLGRLYGDLADKCFDRLTNLIGRYGVGVTPESPGPRWDETDSVLITYGDMVTHEAHVPLATLHRFLCYRLGDAISTVHILPFMPYSSDDGFSVIDYRQVDPTLGDWSHIECIGQDYKLMADLVLNHCSRHSQWFQDFLGNIAPARNYFIEADPHWDLSAVTRPRSLPLLTEVDARQGHRHVWTTFSDDQVDLNFANPDVLFEFLDILLLYTIRRVRVLRLDAIAYLWKEVGTSCIHLPQTHEVVKLIRDFFELLAPQVVILTETNVPHEENVSYFGYGDEAHVVYQFTLPPLLLHALQSGDGTHLRNWAAGLEDPPAGCTFLNFTASHDGIGVRPLEGILSQREIRKLLRGIEKRGGHVSTKSNPDGSESAYELNITYLDALADPDTPDDPLHVERFMCSQLITLGLKGIPAIYFHSLVGTRNNTAGVQKTGMPRTINRFKWQEGALTASLAEDGSIAEEVFTRYLAALRTRREHAAFHPDGAQMVLDFGSNVFAFVRQAPDESEEILAASNLTDEPVKVDLTGDLTRFARKRDLLSDKLCVKKNQLTLKPYQTVWLARGG